MRFITGLLAVSALAGVHASPVPETETFSVAKRGIDSGLFSKLKYYAEYAAASYCTNNNNDTPGTRITCAAGNCPNVEAAGAVSVIEFDCSILTGMKGFLSVSTSRKEIVIAFRGTNSVRNFITDIVFAFVDFNVCSGCSAHAGFALAWAEPRSAILSALSSTYAKYPGYKLVVTGHSLGGAVATLAAAELRSRGYATDLFTYGSPRVGNAALATWISSQSGITARVTHLDDPIPRLPPMFTDFRHTTPEYWLGNGGTTTVDYTASDVTVCKGISTTGCNAGTMPTINLGPHGYYFEHVSACSSGVDFKREEQTSPAAHAPLFMNGGASDAQVLGWMAADIAANYDDF